MAKINFYGHGFHAGLKAAKKHFKNIEQWAHVDNKGSEYMNRALASSARWARGEIKILIEEEESKEANKPKDDS